MNKQELIHKIAEDTDLSQKQAAAALDSMMNAVVSSVCAGEKVQLVGFGTFQAKKREARVGRNPRTGELVQIPASVAPIFKAGKAFKVAVK